MYQGDGMVIRNLVRARRHWTQFLAGRSFGLNSSPNAFAILMRSSMGKG
jgi:hypothetical protein